MLNKIITAIEKPPLYTKTEGEFWNDQHISGQMLKAHLDPAFDGASRNHDFIEKSAVWIKEILPPKDYPCLLDMGCGPGIYAEKFFREGYCVTGVDFSQRSIDYAKKSAVKNNLNIEYLYENYLDMELNRLFDAAVMIYCDYGALSTDDRRKLLQNVYRHLKPGGKILLDVFSMNKYNTFKEEQTWENCSQGGFWRAERYLAIQGNYKYCPNVTLEQTTVITAKDISQYYLWNTCFTKENLISEVENAGFQYNKIWADAAGGEYSEKASTMAVLFEK